ncbi:hypothetical protein [Planktotalea sp.]|uniref:hypothetical protein n=1 Tax=Planktotalea sp. TaxID=2029877 RepID=UPI003F6CAA5D
MSKSTSYRLRYPRATVILTALFLGAFVYLFQTFWLDRATLLVPWKTALTAMVLHVWTLPAVEGNMLALNRRGTSWQTYAANVYASGYTWGALMFLVLAQPSQIFIDGVVWLSAGMIYGFALAMLAKPEQIAQHGIFYDDEHILDQGGARRVLFIIWPFVTIGFVLLLLGLPPAEGWNDAYIPSQLLIFAMLWPRPYAPSLACKRDDVIFTFAGLGMLLAVLFID